MTYGVSGVLTPEDLCKRVQLAVSPEVYISLVCDLADCNLPSWGAARGSDMYGAVIGVSALQLAE